MLLSLIYCQFVVPFFSKIKDFYQTLAACIGGGGGGGNVTVSMSKVDV